MKLLLDTHVWFWSLEDPGRLGRKAAAVLADPAHEPWLSPVSLWEFALLAEKGRIALVDPRDPRAWIEEALRRAPMVEAVLTREVAIASRYVRLEHEDPADRFLAATAQVYDLTLVTIDPRLLRGKGFRTLAAR